MIKARGAGAFGGCRQGKGTREAAGLGMFGGYMSLYTCKNSSGCTLKMGHYTIHTLFSQKEKQTQYVVP